MAKYLTERETDRMSRSYLQGADDQKRSTAKEFNAQENEVKQLRQELGELRVDSTWIELNDLCDDQARIIASMQKQLEKANKRIAEIYEEVQWWRPEQNLDA